ncbi:Beta-ketoacyl synthase [Moelleriella libera RCEF 2490]|uniref:Beta-ketoacyl synthase n=1 Tax=Moelleriella libera RCEF 2490 TaxID=1081109 RepID=A0A168DGX3_9HYPO|nr:Beta-ketoacyl synthase [Moelleriella libera RCEF 2490]
MKTKGLVVEVKACDVSSEAKVVSLLRQIDTHRLPPIRGVLHSAMSLRGEETAVDDWRAALKSKVKGTRNLHKHLPANLDFFITLSSIVAQHGNIGQSNYAAARSYQDAVIRYRSAIELAASSINVGVVLDAGFVSESGGMQGSLRRRGLGYIRVCELLAIIDFAMTHPRSIDPMRSIFAMGAMLVDDADNMDDTSGPLVDCRFAHLVHRSDSAGRAAGNERRTEAADVDVRRLLEGVGRAGEAAEIICNIILRQLGKLLARPAETLDPTQSLDSYGIDSLVAVELRNWIGAYLQASVQLLVLRGASSIRQLANIVAKESRLVRINSS